MRLLAGEFGRLALALAEQDDAEVERLIAKMSPSDLLRFDVCFEAWAHDGQIAPPGEGWRNWLQQGGRGSGKTRGGAEWITGLATQRGRRARIALVAANADEARRVMIEGPSGLLAVGAAWGARPLWEPSLGQLTWPGGSVAHVYSGENPDGLRGPEHDYAWCDELAKWAKPEETWDNLQMGLRRGTRPRALITTTPRPIPLLTRIRAEPWTAVTQAKSGDNICVEPGFMMVMNATYGGTRLGRQELDGELIEDVEGALWTREMVERCRVKALPLAGFIEKGGPPPGPLHEVVEGEKDGDLTPPPALAGVGWGVASSLRRVVIGVDPPASASGDACGIVACGLAADGKLLVLEDASRGGLAPAGWARAVVACAERWQADLVVAESNQGGEMVESVLRQAEAMLPVRPVHARFGKGKRAEPVSMLFARGAAGFAGVFPELEDELCGLTAGGGYQGPGRSPDRADAMVWAMTALMPGNAREPRVRVL